MPCTQPLHLSPTERDALECALECVAHPPSDRDGRVRQQLRQSVSARLRAITFEATVIYGERSEIMLSSDETDLVLDALGSPREPLVAAAGRACELREAIRGRVGALHLELLGASGHREACTRAGA